MEKEIEFFKRLIDGVENSNHAAEQAMTKAYESLFPTFRYISPEGVDGGEVPEAAP